MLVSAASNKLRALRFVCEGYLNMGRNHPLMFLLLYLEFCGFISTVAFLSYVVFWFSAISSQFILQSRFVYNRLHKIQVLIILPYIFNPFSQCKCT